MTVKVDISDLHETIKIIIQLTDYRTALILMKELGGSDFKFPKLKSLTEAHLLSQILGFYSAQKLCQYFSGGSIYIPKSDRYLSVLRNQSILQDLQELGETKHGINKIAKTHGVTTRWVREVRRSVNQPKKDISSNQLDMFNF